MNKKTIVLMAVLVLVAAGLGTAPWWLTPVLGYLTTHKDAIGALGAVAGILGFLGAIAGALWRFVRRPAALPAPGRGVTTIRVDGNVNIVTADGKRIAATDADPALLFDAYLGSLAEECSRLPLGVIDTEFARDRGPSAVRLAEVYVELDVTSHRRPSEEEEERDWAWRLVRGEAAGREPVLAALAGEEARRHVLLGDPGSGKTTLANHLCHALAAGDGGLPETLRGLVPVRFVLRELAARHLGADAAKGKADMLWNALEENLAECVGEAAAKELFPFVHRRLLESGGFVVFDGLDEVPESHRRRQVLLEAVEAFAATLARSPSRLLVTARPYAYADPRWQLADFPILALAPFSEEQVERFISGWYERAARRVFGWNAETAAARSRRLRAALKERPYLGDLASRPLLLTLMATLHSSWGQLPEDRADLYEETVKLLLSRWQRAREVRGRGGEPVVEESISQVLAVDESRLREALEELAYTVHERQGSEPERGSEPADVSEGELLVAFQRLRDLSAEVLLDYLRDRAGLLIERREGVHAFPHRSFQEYLAACHLASLPDPTERFREKAFADPLWWREVVLLGIGRSKRAGMGNAVAIVAALLPSDPAAEGPIPETDWRVAVVCGQALLELRLAEVAGDQPRYRALLERTRKWLAELVAGGRLSPKERLEAGDVLGRLGDPRPGVGILSGEVTGGPELPDVGWVEVPAGSFTMGSAEDDPLAGDWEKPAHPVRLGRFWISRYPITNAQFGLFCESDRYTNREYWTDGGWAWLQGAEPDVSPYPEEIRDEVARWLAGRPKEKRRRPFFWDDPRLSAPTRPVVGVTWYEASAYCRWLEARMRELENVSVPGVDVERPADCRVRLPTEAEWEKAARGSGASTWPWGSELTEGFCNSKEIGLKETSPAGMFPDNLSPCGASDMAGNVWEWTSTIWGKTAALDYKYPYVPDDGREEVNIYGLRVIRGGSFYDDKRFARCAARLREIPEGFGSLTGFRVVFSLANSEF